MGAPIIRYEAGQTAHPFEAMVNSGDATTLAHPLPRCPTWPARRPPLPPMAC